MIYMNCPKCGNYVDDNKEYCFMCGTKLGGSDFSSPGRTDVNPSLNQDYYRKKEEYNNRLKDYRKVEIKRVENDKKDFIDVYTEYKMFFKIGGFIVLAALVVFIYLWVAKANNKDEVLVPKIEGLYYKVSEKLTNTNNNGAFIYSLSNPKGTSCSVTVYLDTQNSSDHVNDFFLAKEQILVPNYDDSGEVVDNMAIPLFQNGSININKDEWYYLNVFYRKNPSDNFTSLRYKYLSAGHNGRFYNIELANYDDSNECNILLDSFLRSLKFID